MGLKSKTWVGWAAGGAIGPLLGALSFAATAEDLRLADAVKNRDRTAVRSLLEQHVNVNAAQPDGTTALAWAANRDDLETADLLIRAGAKVNAANDYGVTALSLACTNRSAAMLERLLKAGADPNAALWTGETPVMVCAHTGNVETVKLLLSHGADPQEVVRTISGHPPRTTEDGEQYGRKTVNDTQRLINRQHPQGQAHGESSQGASQRLALRMTP